MNQLHNETWEGDDGKLKINLSIPCDLDTTLPCVINLSQSDYPKADFQLTLTGLPTQKICHGYPSGYIVEGTFEKRIFLQSDGRARAGIWVDLQYGIQPLQSVTGILALSPDAQRPPPPAPVPPSPVVPPVPPPVVPPMPEVPAGLPVVGDQHDESFNYVYMRPWAPLEPADLERCFVSYAPPSNPGDGLYVELTKDGKRQDRERDASKFIQNTTPPQFVSGLEQLLTNARLLPTLAPLLELWLAEPLPCPFALRQRLESWFGVGDCMAMHAALNDPDYLAELDNLWQSYFALVVMLGYQRPWLECISDMLKAQHALHYLFTPRQALAAGHPALPLATPALVRDLLHASVVLPKPAYPPPPPQASGTGGWIEPYSVGDLHMMRQRLLSLRPGEVAHIENIMRGERREIGRKRLRRQLDSRQSDSGSIDLLDHQAGDHRNSLYEEMRATVAEKTVGNLYDDFDTSYGPPAAAKLSGNWIESTRSGLPAFNDVTRFAHDLVNKTVGRITRNVTQARLSSTLNESEEYVNSLIDNSAGGGKLMAVYRWLNKVYEVDVVNYGNRLMVEFMLPKPAADFLREQQRVDGGGAERPPSLAEAGVNSFRDIEPATYDKLAALYGATEIEPPPPVTRIVSATLRSGEERLVPIPDGYRAGDARVSHLPSSAAAQAPVVLVGTVKFTNDTAAGEPQFGQEGAIPVSVSANVYAFPPAPAPTPLPTPGAAPEPASLPPMAPPPPDALVNVDIICHAGEALMDDWRIRTYDALMRGFQLRFDRYADLENARDGRHGAARSSLANREIERGALRRGCLRLLMERYLSLAGGADAAAGAPSAFDVNEPRYLQFFETLFEWREMSYRWYDSGPGAGGRDDPGAGQDAQFSVFVNAGMARVMLPVRPDRIMALLYFLSSGMLWDGDNAHAPLNEADVGVVDDIKRAGSQTAVAPRQVGPSWELLVPTTMQVLEERL
jgi:hypothetical protein